MKTQLVMLFLFAFAHASCRAQEPLPRVLILGDSVYQQPARELQKELKGKVELVFPTIQQGEIRNTKFALLNFDKLVGEKKWDVIHFNFGLGDLVSRVPGIKDFRVLPLKVGGIPATSPEKYRSNLEKLIGKLKTTNAKLIWASTTPIRHSATGVFEKGSEIKYNQIAADVMKENNIPINDMHTYVKGLIDMNRPASHGADPFHFDRKSIADPILKTIQQAIKHADPS